jgi:hypothetical protein
MGASGPAAGEVVAFLELGADSFDMLAPCLFFFDGDGPADPLVAGERGYVFPGGARFWIGRERFAEIRRKIVDDSPWRCEWWSWKASARRWIR